MAVNKGKEVAASDTSGRKGRKSLCSRPENSGKGAKRQREGVLKFVDDAAMEDEEDSDGMSFIDDIVEEDDEELYQGYTGDVKLGIKHTKSSPRQLHHPFFLKEENMSIEEHEALINKRYSRHVTYEDETKHIDEIFQHSSKDPSIWKVNCTIGREQKIAFSLFQKYIDLQNFGNKLPIISVFAPEHVKGCVYIEAEKEADVTEACKGFYVLYNKKTRVPKDEIPRLLSVKNTFNGLSKGTWVRVKSGNYKGDLAQVVALDDHHKRAMVKLIPRIDLQALSKKFGGGVSLKESGIPTSRLISSSELEAFRPHIQIKRDRLTGENFEVLDGMMLKEGYVYKKVSVASLNWLAVQPSRNELMKFEAAKMDDAEDLNWLSPVSGRQKKVCLEGSNVDLENDKGNGYQLNDLVLFGQKDFGVIISIKGDGIQILKGDTERPRLATISRKDIRTICVDKMFIASDCHKKNISINDIVKVLDGPSEGREGTVRHMYKGILFIYDETQSDNCGFFCAKSQFCLNIKQSKSFKSDKKGSTSSYVDADEPMTTGESNESRDFNSVARRSRPVNFDSPFSVGQTVRIRVGPLKGYLCRVIGIYHSKATVKLDSLVKVLSVNVTDLSEANVKNFGSSVRDTSLMISSGQFGSQDRLTDNGMAAPSGNNAWDSIASGGGRDSWPGSSTLMAEVSCRDGDGKGDNPQGADPWGGNLTSKDSAESKDMDCWDKGLPSSGQVSAWNSSSSVKEPTDSWEKRISRNDDIWGKALAPQNDNISVANGGAWEKKPGNENSGSSKKLMDAWNVNGKSTTANEGDGWGKSVWGNSVSSGNDQRSSWGKRADKKEETNVKGDWRSDWNKPSQLGGWGHGQGRGKGQETTSGETENVGGYQGSCWGSGRGQNSEGNWHQPGDLDGCKGSTWGSGKDESHNGLGSWDRSNNSVTKDDLDGSQDWGKKASSDGRIGHDNQSRGLPSFGSWGRDRHGNWDTCKSLDYSESVGGADEQGNGWGRGKSVACDMSTLEQQKEFNRNKGSDWNNERQGVDETCRVAKQPSGSNNEEGGNWNEAKNSSFDQSGAANDDGSTWNKPKNHSLEVENTDTENATDWVKSAWENAKWSDDGKGWGSSADKSSCWTSGATKTTGTDGSWTKLKVSSDVGKEEDGNGNDWDRSKSCSNTKNTGWNDDGRSWSKPKEYDGYKSHGGNPSGFRSENWNQGGQSSERSRNSGSSRGGFDSGDRGGRSRNWNRGGRSFVQGESSEWNGNHGGGRGRGRGRNFNRYTGNQQNSHGRREFGGWRKDESSSWNQGEQRSGGFQGSSSQGTEKGIFETPKIETDWQSSTRGSSSMDKEAGIGTWNRKPEGGWNSKGDGTERCSWSTGAEFADKDAGWNAGTESSRNVNTGKSCGWDKSNASEKESWGPPKTWPDRQTTCWEKGSASSIDADNRERGWKAKSSSCEEGNSNNWNRNTGPKIWNQEKTQPSSSNPHGNKGNAWESSSWSWEEPKDGNGMQTTGWKKGSGSSMDSDTRERGWEAKSSSREAGDSSKWDRSAGQKTWNQVKTQPSGSNTHGNKGNVCESSSWSREKPKDGIGMQTTGWEKGSGSSMDADTREAKSSCGEAGDSNNWNGNAVQKIWNQEKTQPSGSNSHGNKDNAWEGTSGSWEKPKDGNGSNVGKGGW